MDLESTSIWLLRRILKQSKAARSSLRLQTMNWSSTNLLASARSLLRRRDGFIAPDLSVLKSKFLYMHLEFTKYYLPLHRFKWVLEFTPVGAPSKPKHIARRASSGASSLSVPSLPFFGKLFFFPFTHEF